MTSLWIASVSQTVPESVLPCFSESEPLLDITLLPPSLGVQHVKTFHGFMNVHGNVLKRTMNTNWELASAHVLDGNTSLYLCIC